MNTKKTKELFCLAATGVIIASSQALAETKTYTVGVEGHHYYPYYKVGEDGEYGGFARAVLDAFAEDYGCKFNYKPLPVKRLFSSFVKGELDFKFPDNAYWSADLKEGLDVHYSEGVVSYIDGVMDLPENKGKGLGELKVLGTVLGFTAWGYGDLIEEKKVRLTQNNKLSQLLKQTMVDRVDGAYASIAVANYVLKNELNKDDALVFDPDLPHSKGHYRLSSLKEGGMIKAFNLFLIENKEKVDAIKKQFDLMGFE